MRKTDILIAGALLALAATASPLRGQEGKANPTVWMGPPSYENGKCFRELFEHPDAWQETRSAIDVLMYADHQLHRQFTDDELRAWFFQLQQWRLKFALEVGAVKPWGVTGEKTFEVQRPKWDRFRDLGAEIYAIAMDEPLLCCRKHIHKSDDHALEETANFIARVRQQYPDMLIGDIETYPSIPLEDHFWWLDALGKRLAEMQVRGLDFYRLDVNWAEFVVFRIRKETTSHYRKGTVPFSLRENRDSPQVILLRVLSRGGWPEVKKLEQHCRQRKMPFSLICWASGYPGLARKGLADDSTWYVSIMQQGYNYALVQGSPDQFVIESWLEGPSRSIPASGRRGRPNAA